MEIHIGKIFLIQTESPVISIYGSFLDFYLK